MERGGRLFKAYKFRSMVRDAEKGRAVWAQENDPRVSRVGRFLRRTHIDEFPQFLNILKGEMTAVQLNGGRCFIFSLFSTVPQVL